MEAKEYSLDLPIKVSDIEGPSAESYMLRLRGSGFHFEKTKPVEGQFYEDLPLCRAHLTDNGSMAAFSTESIDFGDMKAGELQTWFYPSGEPKMGPVRCVQIPLPDLR